MRTVTALPVSIIEDFSRDGAVVVRGAFTPSEVALVAAGIDVNLVDPSPLALVASDASDPGEFVEDFRNWQRIQQYRQFIMQSPATNPVASRPAVLQHRWLPECLNVDAG